MATLNRTTFTQFTPVSSYPDMAGNANKVLLTTGGGMYWGITPIAGGGTGQTTAQAGIDALTTGNLNLTGASSRIRGDFSNATNSLRPMFQTSITNGSTNIGVIPNGTSASAMFSAFNSQNPTNSSMLIAGANGNEVTVVSGQTGTGPYLPLTLYANNTLMVDIGRVAGTVSIGTTSLSNTTLNTVGSGNGVVQNRVYNDTAGALSTSQLVLQTKTAGSTLILSQLDNSGSPYALITSSGSTTIPMYHDFATHIFRNHLGAERFRIASAGQIGLGGANYGTNYQVLVSTGSTSSAAWADPITALTGGGGSGTIPITAGGTGASTSAQALVNLGVEVSGRNSQGTKIVEPITAGVPSNAIGIDGDIRYQY